MHTLTKKLLLCSALTAALFLTAVYVGGNFLHEHLHHHASHQELEECSFVLLAVQALYFAVVTVFADLVFCSPVIGVIREFYSLNIWCTFSSPRAPPFVYL